MNVFVIVKMSLNRRIIKTFYGLHKVFRKNHQYKILSMIRCGLNIIKHDRLVEHGGYYLVNSFIPPINSQAFETIAYHVSGENQDFFENHTRGVRTAPISTYIAITNQCMYHCWHCSAQKFMKYASQQKDLTTNQWLYIIQELQNLGVGIIGFTGGEPLLRKDLIEIISSIDERSVSYIFTSGYGLTYEYALALKQAGLFGIAISIDSLDDVTHNEMRGNNHAYEYAVKAIENAKKAGLYTMSQTVCTRELLQSSGLEDLAIYLKTLQVDEMRIMEPLPCGALKEKSSAVLNHQEKQQLIQLHITMNKDKRYPKVSVFPYVESPQQFGCGAGVQHSYVDAYGNFGACDFIDQICGNILEENIKDIWNQMHHCMGGPHLECIAKCPHATQDLPLFYRLLKGEKQ